MPQISAFLIVKDQRDLLPRCLESLVPVVDHIAVLDTGSVDGTQEILQRFAARGAPPPLSWQQRPFDGFGRSRQRALDLVKTEWALWIDADETVSAPLRQKLMSLRADGSLDDFDAYEIRRRNRVLGRVMRARNQANDYPLRLFRTRQGSITPTPVHEGVALEPGSRLGRITEPLWHDTMVTWADYLTKVNHYTTLDAERSQRSFNPIHLLFAPWATFLRHYLGRGGIIDGWPGFVWAATSAWSTLLRDLKLLRRSVQRWNCRSKRKR